jgi:phenylalanyl-tRNA synthetase beta chain
VVAALNPAVELTAADADCEPLDPAASCRLLLDGRVLAYVGRLTDAGREPFDLRGETSVAEMQLAPLVELADFNRRYERPPAFPAIARDLNLVVDESVRWGELADTVRELAGGYFEQLTYLDTYRDAERLGPGKKSLLMNLALRWSQGTMTGEQADELREKIVDACRKRHGAELR